MTYSDIAKQIAFKKGLARISAQAVGGAVGHNEILTIIPCHRVVGRNGCLTAMQAALAKNKIVTVKRG